MIGKDEEQEVSFKVADRRKFNADGSLKDGVTLEPEKPVERPVAAATEPGPLSKSELPPKAADEQHDEMPADDGYVDEEIPGADDPASFVNFLSTLATNAAASLGAVPHPATGKRSLDLDTGKYWL